MQAYTTCSKAGQARKLSDRIRVQQGGFTKAQSEVGRLNRNTIETPGCW